MHDTIHTLDQLADARNVAAERQRRAEELRAVRSGRRDRPGRPHWAPTTVRRVVTAGGAAVLVAVAVLGSTPSSPAEATTDAVVEQDTYTGTDQRLQPGLPDRHWAPDTSVTPSHAVGRVR